MNKIIEEQLKQVVYADLAHFDATTNTYHIPKYSKPIFELMHTYIIELPNDIINNNESILATNWNKGTSPKSKYIKGYISKINGKYVYVDSVSYNLEANVDGSDIWSGYLPINALIQIKQIN